MMPYLGLLALRDGELVVEPESGVEGDGGGDADLEVDVGADLLEVLPVGDDAGPVAVVLPAHALDGQVAVVEAALERQPPVDAAHVLRHVLLDRALLLAARRLPQAEEPPARGGGGGCSLLFALINGKKRPSFVRTAEH